MQLLAYILNTNQTTYKKSAEAASNNNNKNKTKQKPLRLYS